MTVGETKKNVGPKLNLDFLDFLVNLQTKKDSVL